MSNEAEGITSVSTIQTNFEISSDFQLSQNRLMDEVMLSSSANYMPSEKMQVSKIDLQVYFPYIFNFLQ